MENSVAKLTFADYRGRNIEIAETARVAMERHRSANRNVHYDKKLAERHLFTSLKTDSLDSVQAPLEAMLVQEAFPLTAHERPYDMALYVETLRKLVVAELESLKQ